MCDSITLQEKKRAASYLSFAITLANMQSLNGQSVNTGSFTLVYPAPLPPSSMNSLPHALAPPSCDDPPCGEVSPLGEKSEHVNVQHAKDQDGEPSPQHPPVAAQTPGNFSLGPYNFRNPPQGVPDTPQSTRIHRGIFPWCQGIFPKCQSWVWCQ